MSDRLIDKDEAWVMINNLKDKLTEESASLEGCIRESTNKIVAALLVNACQMPGSSNEQIICRGYHDVLKLLKEIEVGK